MPLYRQLNVVELYSLAPEAVESYICETPRDDIFAAFDYFLKNVNKGERPFIIYGYSQGGKLTRELATTFLGNRKYCQNNKNLIAAYAIGCSVTQSQIDQNPNLKFSQNDNDTGVIVSWNTTAPSEAKSGAYKDFCTWKQGALMTNPLTWKTDETTATAVQFAGMTYSTEGIMTVTGNADATVDKARGILLVTTVDETEYMQIIKSLSKYHTCDVLFFSDSISKNIKDRIAAF